jgi:enoyl-CoA hydratase/carnithine racemase
MADTLQISQPAPGVRLLTIARPQRRNALDRATYASLTAALAQAARDDAVRALVLTGAGGVFSSGADLADFQDVADLGQPSAGLTFLRALAAFPKPVVAAVEGMAIGIGATMLLHCDLAYIAENATLRLPFTALGLCPEGASSYLLPLLAGSKRAAELLMLGEPFDASAACAAGLANATTPAGEALATALAKAQALAALPPAALATTKSLLRAGSEAAVAATLERESRLFHALRRAPEAQAAFSAFLCK